jgi:addiction module HigA family antidote
MIMRSVHPGEILAEELEARNMTANALAIKLRTNRQAIADILAGKRAITPIMALRLGRYLGTGPGLWVRMQADYDLWKAEQTYGKQIRREVEKAA